MLLVDSVAPGRDRPGWSAATAGTLGR